MFPLQVYPHLLDVDDSTTFYSLTLAFHYALDVLSQSVLGVSFGLLEDAKHHWLTGSLMSGNIHMYLQLAWPALFSRLRRICDVTLLTYPRYHEDSRRFAHLCRTTAIQVEERPPNATLALMMTAAPTSVPMHDVHLEAFSYIRGGNVPFCFVLSKHTH